MLAQELVQQTDILAESGYERLFENNPVGLFLIDGETRLAHLNQRAAQIFGYADVDAARGRPLSQLEFFLSRELLDRITHLIHDDQPFKIHGFPGTNLAGHFAYYCLTCNRARDAEGRPLGVFGIIEDVTGQMRKQQELNDRVNELSLLSQVSQVASSAFDTDDVLKVILTGVTARQGLGFNRAFLFFLDDAGQALTGYMAVGPSDAEEAGYIWSALERENRSLLEILSMYKQESIRINHNLTDVIHSMRIDITDGSLIAQAMRDHRPVTIDADMALDPATEQVLHRLGKREAAMTPLVSRDKPIGLLIVDNAITHKEITDHDRQFLKLIADQTAAAVERANLYRDLKLRAQELEDMNQRLAETQNQIIEAEKMSVIGEITAAVAHELRNPLTIIGGFANLMHRNLEPGAGDGEYLNIIISETQRAEAVLTDVLDFSRASRTRDRILDLNRIIQNAVDMLSVRLGNGKGRFKLALSATPLQIWGNGDQMLHAIYQIFSSVVTDLPADIVPRVVSSPTSQGSRMALRFEPAGRQSEKIEKILRQYFSGGSSTKRLSLLVAEETLKHHGGNLGIESDPGHGPTLCVDMPLYKEKGDAQDSDS